MYIRDRRTVGERASSAIAIKSRQIVSVWAGASDKAGGAAVARSPNLDRERLLLYNMTQRLLRFPGFPAGRASFCVPFELLGFRFSRFGRAAACL